MRLRGRIFLLPLSIECRYRRDRTEENLGRHLDVERPAASKLQEDVVAVVVDLVGIVVVMLLLQYSSSEQSSMVTSVLSML